MSRYSNDHTVRNAHENALKISVYLLKRKSSAKLRPFPSIYLLLLLIKRNNLNHLKTFGSFIACGANDRKPVSHTKISPLRLTNKAFDLPQGNVSQVFLETGVVLWTVSVTHSTERIPSATLCEMREIIHRGKVISRLEGSGVAPSTLWLASKKRLSADTKDEGLTFAY